MNSKPQLVEILLPEAIKMTGNTETQARAALERGSIFEPENLYQQKVREGAIRAPQESPEVQAVQAARQRDREEFMRDLAFVRIFRTTSS